MFGHFRSKTHNNVSMFVPWLAPFLPLFFTDEGNQHRRLFFRNLGLAFIFIAIFVGVTFFMESQV